MDTERTTRLAPRDDSSDLVVHARRTMFVMLLVCAFVTVGVLFRDTDRLHRALAEAEIVVGLMAHWHYETRDPRSDPLGRIIAGPASTEPDSVLSFELHLVPLQYENREHFDDVQCTVELDLRHYFFVTTDGDVNYIAVYDNAPGGSELLQSLFGGGGRIWEQAPLTPTDLSSFAKLWDVLVASREAARITSVEPSLGTMKDSKLLSREGGNSDRIRTSYRVDKSMQVEVGHKVRNSVETGIEVPRDFVERGINGRKIPAAIWTHKYPDIILDLWAIRDVDALTLGRCYNHNVQTDNVTVHPVILPATIEFSLFDWVGAWVDQAINSGRLKRGTVVASRPFDEAFADLLREATRLESLDLEDLKAWLKYRIDTESKESVFLGVSVPSSVLRLVGIALMVAAQAYATLHMAEAAARMRRSAGGDPGAFKPWIILYDGVAARFGAFCVIVVPSLAVLLVLERLTEGKMPASTLGWISLIGLVVSVGLSILALTRSKQLRIAAQDHHRHCPSDRASATESDD